jgi:hypothetical protein
MRLRLEGNRGGGTCAVGAAGTCGCNSSEASAVPAKRRLVNPANRLALLPGPEPKGRIRQATEVNGQIGLKPLWNMAL